MNIEPIDTSTTAGKIRVMQLADDGRKVVSRAVPRVRPSYASWGACEGPLWDWPHYDYAILREPAEIWLNFFDDDEWYSYATRDEAIDAANRSSRVTRAAIHFREVIENG